MKQKGFTLVEMLLVIVIIGVLAATILPNILGARDRADDTARITSLTQMVAPLINYSAKKRSFPKFCWNMSKLEAYIGNDIERMPLDPRDGANVSDIIAWTTDGEYGYCAISRDGIKNSAFALVARVIKEDKWNYNGGEIDANSDANELQEKLSWANTGKYYVLIKS